MAPNWTRRSIVLTVIPVVLVIEIAIGGYLFLHGNDVGPGVGWMWVGSTEQVASAGVTFVESVPAYVVATPEGLIGLYARSPQMGEPVAYCASSGWFEDRAHGSMFDSLGDYVLGPAPRGLDRLDVRAIGNDVWIDTADHFLGAPRGTHSVQPSGPFCTGGSR